MSSYFDLGSFRRTLDEAKPLTKATARKWLELTMAKLDETILRASAVGLPGHTIRMKVRASLDADRKTALGNGNYPDPEGLKRDVIAAIVEYNAMLEGVGTTAENVSKLLGELKDNLHTAITVTAAIGGVVLIAVALVLLWEMSR